jgi:hypothetical protein
VGRGRIRIQETPEADPGKAGDRQADPQEKDPPRRRALRRVPQGGSATRGRVEGAAATVLPWGPRGIGVSLDPSYGSQPADTNPSVMPPQPAERSRSLGLPPSLILLSFASICSDLTDPSMCWSLRHPGLLAPSEFLGRPPTD